MENFIATGKVSVNKKGDIVLKPSKKSRGNMIYSSLRHSIERGLINKVYIRGIKDFEHYAIDILPHCNSKQDVANCPLNSPDQPINTYTKPYSDLKPYDMFMFCVLIDGKITKEHLCICLQYGNRKTIKDITTGRTLKDVLYKDYGLKMDELFDDDTLIHTIIPDSLMQPLAGMWNLFQINNFETDNE